MQEASERLALLPQMSYHGYCESILILVWPLSLEQVQKIFTVMNQWQEIRNSTLMKSKFCTLIRMCLYYPGDSIRDLFIP